MKDNIELPKTDDDLIIACRSVCTICHATDIQIHHIDGNHENDTPENKTVLCQKHHDQAQKDIEIINSYKGSGQKIKTATRLLRPDLVITYRDKWIKKCSEIPSLIRENQELKSQLRENQELIMKRQITQQKDIDTIKRKLKVV